MKFKNTVKAGLLSLMLMALLSACTPDLPDYISDYDLVYTKEYKAFNFAAVKTYNLPDTVIYDSAGRVTDKHQYDDLIISTIKSNLNALGWSEIKNGKADVLVLATGNSTLYGSCVSYCGWCYWYWYPGWGYYPPGWGGGWGWYYPTDIVCSSYNAGTVSVAITNPNAPPGSSKQLPVTWVGILNGLVEVSDAEIRSRITTNINQMFIQSPYLKK